METVWEIKTSALYSLKWTQHSELTEPYGDKQKETVQAGALRKCQQQNKHPESAQKRYLPIPARN